MKEELFEPSGSLHLYRITDLQGSLHCARAPKRRETLPSIDHHCATLQVYLLARGSRMTACI